LVEQLVNMGKFTVELRHIALNAQLHASRIASGTALEELASQTRRNSDDMRTTTDQLLADLRQVMAQLEGVSSRLWELLSISECDDAALSACSDEVRRDLSTMTSRTASSFAVATRRFSTLRQRIDTTVIRAKLGKETTGALERAEQFFGLIAKKTAPWSDEAGKDSKVAEWLTSMRLGYVMQSQRDVHDQATAGNPFEGDDPSAVSLVAALESTQPTCSEFGDNVELF